MPNINSKAKDEFVNRLIKFTLGVITLTDNNRLPKFRSINDQVIRSASSIGANIVEASGSGSRRDYTRYFEIALKSANETKYWLVLVGRANIELAGEAKVLLAEVEEIRKIIAASILTLKR